MKKAEQLLRETKLPINQISESIGIVNTNYRTGRNHRVIHPVLRTVHELLAVDFHNFSENELIFCAFTLIMCIEH